MKVTVALISVATTTFGVTIGMLVGLSRSPVVSVVIPVMFSLIGGSSGFYFAKLNLGTDFGRKAVSLFSLGITLVCVGTIAGALMGIHIKNSTRTWSVLAEGASDLLPAAAIDGYEVDWLMLDAKLFAMGLSQDERRKIIGRIGRSHSSIEGDRLRNELTWLLATFESIFPLEDDVMHFGEWLSFREKLVTLKRSADGITGAVIEPETFVSAIDELLRQLDRLADDDDDVAHLEGDPKRAAAKNEFDLRLRNLSFVMTRSISPAKKAIEKLSEFLSKEDEGLRFYQELASGERELKPTG